MADENIDNESYADVLGNVDWESISSTDWDETPEEEDNDTPTYNEDVILAESDEGEDDDDGNVGDDAGEYLGEDDEESDEPFDYLSEDESVVDAIDPNDESASPYMEEDLPDLIEYDSTSTDDGYGEDEDEADDGYFSGDEPTDVEREDEDSDEDEAVVELAEQQDETEDYDISDDEEDFVDDDMGLYLVSDDEEIEAEQDYLEEDELVADETDPSGEDVIELDYDSPENPYTVECDCICAVKTGDRVMVQLVNGEPTVIGVVGWGDALQSDVDAAKGSAKEAHDAAVAAQEDAAAANASAQSAEASARAASESADNAIAQAQRAEGAAVAAEGLARTANASAIEAAMRASDAGRSASVAQAALGSMTVDWHDYIAEVIDGEWVVYHKDDATKTNVIGSISMAWQDKDGLHIVGEKGRLDIEQSGITINDSAGAVLASFGSSATIGNDAGGKFVMSDSSLSAYDKGTKYFEVTKDGMKFGLFDVASKGYADTAKSEAISAAAADATGKVNAIKIGGRNLVKNSVWVADGNYSDYKWSKIASRVDTKVGETYTFSLYFNDILDTTTDHGYGYIHAFDADGNVVVRDYFSTASESQRTKTIGNGIAYLIVYAGVRNCVVGDVYKLKLESGNKATDWTPAPEDVEADATAKAEAAQNAAIAAAGSEADLKIEAATENMATTDDIPTKVSDLDNDSGFQDASQVQSAANTAKGEAISAAASDATSKADAALADAKEYVAKSMQFTEDGLEIADMRNGSPVGTRAVLGTDALSFKDSDGSDIARFGVGMARIGNDFSSHAEIHPYGMTIFDQDGNASFSALPNKAVVGDVFDSHAEFSNRALDIMRTTETAGSTYSLAVRNERRTSTGGVKHNYSDVFIEDGESVTVENCSSFVFEIDARSTMESIRVFRGKPLVVYDGDSRVEIGATFEYYETTSQVNEHLNILMYGYKCTYKYEPRTPRTVTVSADMQYGKLLTVEEGSASNMTIRTNEYESYSVFYADDTGYVLSAGEIQTNGSRFIAINDGNDPYGSVLGTGLIVDNQESERKISYIVGSGGNNAGIWDNNLGKWLIYSNGSTDRTLLHGNKASVDDSGIYSGLKGSAIITESISLFSSVSIAAGGYESGTVNLASRHSGYKPIAVVGQYVNSRYVGFGQAYIDDDDVLHYLVHNNTSSARSTNASLKIMFVR